jgi:hypothetical protein
MLVAVHDISLKDSLQLLSAKDLIKHGRHLIPSAFYIWGFYDELHLEEHSATPGYDFSKWEPWLIENRIFINKPNIDL